MKAKQRYCYLTSKVMLAALKKCESSLSSTYWRYFDNV